MKLSLKNSLGFAIAVALSIGAAVNASASTLAQSTLQITNVLFSNAAGTAILDASEFRILVIQDSTNLNPFLNGVFNPYSNSTVGGAPLPFTERCVPASCAGLAAGFANAATPPASDGARAASQLDGAPITGLGIGTGANARTTAIAQLVNPGVANSSANLGLIASFAFQLGTSQAVRFDFDALVHLIAFGNSPLQTANAGVGFTIDIVDQTTGGTNVFHWAPDGMGTGITGGSEIADDCNLQASRGVVFAGTASYDCSGHEAALTGILLADDIYTLTISHQNRADVSLAPTDVPEPATLALLGIGLLGVGVGIRRKHQV